MQKYVNRTYMGIGILSFVRGFLNKTIFKLEKNKSPMRLL